ncbi:MAG: hypothetical protein KF819_37775 [Labilithrix sp.]|nr:hypothetical protein [Labilithrix sp.]
MTNPGRHHFWMFLAASALVACSKKNPEPASTHSVTQAPKNAVALAAAEQADRTGDLSGEGKLDPNDPKHGQRKLMGLDVGVYVDGKQISVLRYGDMPAAVAVETLEGGARRYRLYDYLKAIGVAPETVKSVHLHGNNDRIASVEGAELLKDKKRFAFAFLAGDTGAPISRWATDGLKNEFVVHEFRRVTVYVNKPSPLVDAKRSCHVGADGECSDAIPYATGDAVKGTRVYVDGKMVGFVKRRQLAEALVMGDTPAGERKYNVSKLIAQMGVDTHGIQAVELIAGDDVIARASSEKWTKLAPEFFFTLPKHNHGKVRVHVPAELQTQQEGVSDRDALVSSVQVYKTTKPVDRELTAISEDTDMSVQVAANTAPDQLGRGER